jgi:hypothetical protein
MEANASVDLLRLLPPIGRARGYRLYALDGRRFLDLWQDDGRGILGAKGTGIGTVVKASVDRGLAMPLPSAWEHRLEKAVLAAWPGYAAVRFRPDPAGEPPEGLLHDPARRAVNPETGEGTSARALLLRPFAEYLPAPPPFDSARLRLPCPRAFAPIVLLFRDAESASRCAPECVPPMLLAAAAKALAELSGYASTHGEEHWRRVDRRLSRLFERKGPYLFPRCGAAEYPRLFVAALERGVLLSPRHDLPSLVPGDFDDGELKPLAALDI